ncbi:MAG: ribose-phosphate pyrophosphokinase [Alphaproteobacteria bacterium GM202ARS2]|nr:ribose-phosphate pyrophosphokinase [Alphaproteobacteria bacterium GM202ARS2]
MTADIKVFCGNSNRPLAQAICKSMRVELGMASVRRFPDMEVSVEINENVRGTDAFFIQSLSFPANDHIMELLVALDALRRGSAQRVTAVIPYYGYARQDRKSGPRTPISAKLLANLVTAAGASRCLMLDLHAGQIQGFFDIPVDNLYAAPVFVKDIEKNYLAGGDVMIVSPDVGGVVRARSLAKRLNIHELAIIDKRRERAGQSEVMNVIGDCSGKRCLIIDDIIDSAGTLCNAAQALMERGARSVMAYASHGIFSGGAMARIMAAPLEHVIVSDSIELTDEAKTVKTIRQISIAPLLGEAIRRIHNEESVSSLFN